jgi:hypothetical protein
VKRKVRPFIAAILALTGLTLSACSKSKSPDVVATPAPSVPTKVTASPSPSATPDRFACELLTSEEIESVQGQAVANTMPSQNSSPGLLVHQCYFQLPTPANSVVLTVTRKGSGAAARDPRESWREIFEPDEARDKKEREKEEGEEKKKPDKVEGVGDEAFWTGSRVGGALYVLKGDSYIRISVGGAGDEALKIERCKALAAAALKRLP